MRECLNEQLLESEFVRYDSQMVTRIRFVGRSGLYIDNLAIAKTALDEGTFS